MFQEHILGACALVLCEPMNVGTGGTEWSASDDEMNTRNFTLCVSPPMTMDS